MIVTSEFKAAWWLPSAHGQTLYATLTRSIKAPVTHKERLELPDGDFIDLAWASADLALDSPLIVILHGLGGGVNSNYIAGLMQAFNKQGWRAVLMHFRGASHEPNRLARAYHSGDTADLDYFLNILGTREALTQKAVVGISLGGNVLLKWLGQEGRQQQLIKGAVAVSVPFQLNLVADRVNRGFSRIYQKHLLQRLRAIFKQKIAHYPDNFSSSLEQIDKWKCFWTFDDNITAPLNGFANVHSYYRKASSRFYLPYIQTPTLIIHALDDPFMSPQAIPQPEELSKAIQLELSLKGGHVGFISGNIPGKGIYWIEQRIPQFISQLFSI